jgi:hypothetical protein
MDAAQTEAYLARSARSGRCGRTLVVLASIRKVVKRARGKDQLLQDCSVVSADKAGAGVERQDSVPMTADIDHT